MKRFAVPLVLTVILSAAAIWWIHSVTLVAPQASAQSVPIDALLRLELDILAVIFVLCMVFFLYSLVAFRRRAGDDPDADGEHFHSHNALEVAWTAIPVVIVVGMGIYGARVLLDLDSVRAARQPDDVHVKVVGQQWVWSFEYPEQGIVSPDLVLPVNQPAFFSLEAVDVMHSFWVPEFRLKMDTIPGRANTLRLTPSVVGEYKVRCAELCGTRHAYMESPVRVVEQDVFVAWVDEQLALANDPVRRGEAAAQQFACIGCHTTDGTVLVGPTWKGLFGSERTFADGTTTTADEAYLRASIINPDEHVVEGFADNLMPEDLGERMSDEQIADVIEYIKTIE